MKKLIVFIVFLPFASFATQLDKKVIKLLSPLEEEKPETKLKCDNELKRVCKTKDIRACLKQGLQKFSNDCQLVVMKRLVSKDLQEQNKKAEAEVLSCRDEIDRYCGTEGLNEQCLNNKLYNFSKKCQSFVLKVSPDSKENKPIINCMKNFEKLCPIKLAEIQKGGQKAMHEYTTCLYKSIPKMEPRCRKIFDTSSGNSKETLKRIQYLNSN